jgi:hypothetical protein
MDEDNKQIEWWELPQIKPSTPVTNYQIYSLLSDLDGIGSSQPSIALQKTDNE